MATPKENKENLLKVIRDCKDKTYPNAIFLVLVQVTMVLIDMRNDTLLNRALKHDN